MRGSAARIAVRWDAFWFTQVDARPLGAFRALMGGFLTLYFLSLAPYVEALFSDRGVYHPWQIPEGIAPGVLGAWALWAGALGASVWLATGWRARWAARVTLAFFLWHYFLTLAVQHSAYDRLVIIFLSVLTLADGGRAYALGAPSGAATVAAWAGRLLRFQVIALYLGSGLWKAANPAWQGGELLWYTLQGMWATPIGRWVVSLGGPGWLWKGLCWSVIPFEILLALSLWYPRTRRFGVAVGLAFHLSNTTLLLIPWFFVVAAVYPLFVWPPRRPAAAPTE